MDSDSDEEDRLLLELLNNTNKKEHVTEAKSSEPQQQTKNESAPETANPEANQSHRLNESTTRNNVSHISATKPDNSQNAVPGKPIFDVSQVDRYELIGENSHLRAKIQELNRQHEQQLAQLRSEQQRILAQNTSEVEKLKGQLEEVTLDRQLLQTDLRTLQGQHSKKRPKRSAAEPSRPRSSHADSLMDGFSPVHTGATPLSPRKKRPAPPPRLKFDEPMTNLRDEPSVKDNSPSYHNASAPIITPNLDIVGLCNDHFMEDWKGTQIKTLDLLAQCPLLDGGINVEREVRCASTPVELAHCCVEFAVASYDQGMYQICPPLLAILATLVQVDESCISAMKQKDSSGPGLSELLVQLFEQIWVHMLGRLDKMHRRMGATTSAYSSSFSQTLYQNSDTWPKEEFTVIFADTQLAWCHMIMLYELDVFEIVAALAPESLWATALPSILMSESMYDRVPASILCRSSSIIQAMLEDDECPLSYVAVLRFVEPLLCIRVGGIHTMEVYKSIYTTFNGYADYACSKVCQQVPAQELDHDSDPLRKRLVMTYVDLFQRCIDFVHDGPLTLMTRIDLKVRHPDRNYEFGLCCVQQMYESLLAENVVQMLLGMIVKGGLHVPKDVESVLSSVLYTLMARLADEVQEVLSEPADRESRVQVVSDIVRFLETLWVLDESGSSERQPQILVPQPEHIIVLARIALSGTAQQEKEQEQENIKQDIQPVFPEEVMERARYIIEQCTTISESNEIYLMMMAVED